MQGTWLELCEGTTNPEYMFMADARTQGLVEGYAATQIVAR